MGLACQPVHGEHANRGVSCLRADIQSDVHHNGGDSSIVRGADDVGVLAHLVHHDVAHRRPVTLKLHADGAGHHLPAKVSHERLSRSHLQLLHAQCAVYSATITSMGLFVTRIWRSCSLAWKQAGKHRISGEGMRSGACAGPTCSWVSGRMTVFSTGSTCSDDSSQDGKEYDSDWLAPPGVSTQYDSRSPDLLTSLHNNIMVHS